MGLARFIFALLFFFASFYSQAYAQENWEIDDYKTDINIEATGEISVKENIDVDFGSEKHGIYRDIPYEYQTQDGGEPYYTEVNVTEVLQDGSKAEYELIKENGNLRIKIGDPDRTISGKHSYKIIYSVQGVLKGYEDYDELYWNVIGSAWEVPINKAQAKVTLPGDEIINFTCFIGVEGSEETCETESVSDKEIVFSVKRTLLPYEGLTIAVGYTKGMVPLLVAIRPKTLFEKFFEGPSMATFISSAIFSIAAVLFLWYRHGRDYWYKNIPNLKSEGAGVLKPFHGHETVVVEYDPPEDLRPAEIGVLVDETAHTHDVTSTIVDLATKGYLMISELEKSWKFGKSDYKFNKKGKDTKNLLEYEKLLLSHLFKSGREVKMSSLKQTFYDELTEVKKKLYEDVLEKGLFLKNPEKIRNTYLGFAIAGLVAAGGLFFAGLNFNTVFLIDLALGLLTGSLLLIVFARFMPRRTAKGRELYRRTKGYRLFISTVETHRQRFFEKKNMFNEVLPYAMVFELTDKYVKALSGLELQKQTSTWYRGTNAFTMGHFASSMNTFSSSVGTAISSVPKSSGSSGGGSSGGGFGGGGGGSW